MREFIFREVTEECLVMDNEGTSLKLSVTRSRNSNGDAAIKIRFGYDDVVTFTADVDYELSARLLAEMLVKIADNRCELPSTKPSNNGVH